MNRDKKRIVAMKTMETICTMANRIDNIIKASDLIEDDELRNAVKGEIAMRVVDFLEGFDSYTRIGQMIDDLEDD